MSKTIDTTRVEINKSKRIFEFDLIRSLCMLYIVGVWHFNDYLVDYSFGGKQTFYYLTIAVLATFSFVSGYMLRKYEFNSMEDVWFFYKKRLLRFYPLFILSAVSLYAMHWMSTKPFLFCIGGLAMFTPNPVKTLWFISMLMFLYFITPFVKWKINFNKNNFILSIIFFILLIILVCFKVADERILMYSPLYTAGLFCKDLNINKLKWLLILVCSIIMGGIFLIFEIIPVIQGFAIAVFGCSFIVSLGFLLPTNKSIERIVGVMAYCSMAAYLFHRQIFGVAIILFGIQGINGTYLQLWIAVLTLVVVGVFSWLLQYGYDWILKKVVDRHK